MTVWQSISGMLRIRITSADIEQMLNALTEYGIPIYHLETIDLLTIECSIFRSDYSRIASVCEKQGNTIVTLSKQGIFWVGKTLVNRPVLGMGIALLILLAMVLPTRIYFFSVEGNQQIPDRRILEAAEECGIRFGVSRRSVRSEKMKNALLAALPELQWAGINTSGCRGIISVRERQETTAKMKFPEINTIVASRDGVIISCTATKGNALCSTGQIVKKDQLLISPYVDCGLSIKVVPARGEVFAYTSRNIRAVTPAYRTDVRENDNKDKHYSVVIGKKRINLWKGSGIYDATCGRMYEEYYFTLPGGFRLPVCLIAETLISRTTGIAEVSESEAQKMLQAFAVNHVSHQMIAGNILSEDTSISRKGGLWVSDGQFECTEMIGQERAERNGVLNE